MSKTLLSEIKNIALITAALGIIQIAIAVWHFGLPAVLGTIVGYAAALLNFSLMGIVLERSLSNGKGSSAIMGIGYMARLALLAAVIIWSMKADYLNYVCVIIPLLFPQIAIFVLNAFRKKERKSDDNERT